MISFKNLYRRYKAWRYQEPISFAGGRTEGQSPSISDGVDYSQPIAIPGTIRALNAPDTQEQYLKEVASYSQAQTFRFQFDTPMRSTADAPIMPTLEDPLKEWDYSTRVMVLTNCHSAYQRNPGANTAVQYTTGIVRGKGFNLIAKNEEIDKFLNDFIDDPDNNIREYERQALNDLQVDGELFIRYFTEGGKVVAVPLRPWECAWIETELGFFRRVKKYHFLFQKTKGDTWEGGQEFEQVDIPADEIQHVPINRHAYELRGRPELYRVLPWLRADTQFLENRARQNHWRTALLWMVSVANASAAQVASVLQRWSRPPSPGTVAVESDNVTVEPLVNPVGANEANEDGRQIRLKWMMGFRMPEFYFSDGYNANLATASAQQMPAMTKFEDFQTIMVEQLWTPMFRRVLQTAIDAGLLPLEVEEQDEDGEPVTDEPAGAVQEPKPEKATEAMIGEMPDGKPAPKAKGKMIETIKAFDVSYANLQEAGKLDLATALEKMKQNGWIDDITAMEELNVDPKLIQKRLKNQQVQEQAEIKAGMKPPTPEMLAQMDAETRAAAVAAKGNGVKA